VCTHVAYYCDQHVTVVSRCVFCEYHRNNAHYYFNDHSFDRYVVGLPSGLKKVRTHSVLFIHNTRCTQTLERNAEKLYRISNKSLNMSTVIYKREFHEDFSRTSQMPVFITKLIP